MRMKVIMSSILVVFVCMCGCVHNMKYEERGNVMKRNLHFCSYEIWDGFREEATYKLLIKKDVGYANIFISSITSKDKLDSIVDMDVKRQFLELKKEKDDKWISIIQKEKVKIGGKKGIKVFYEFSHKSKGEASFEEFKQMKRVYYINNDEYVTKVEIRTFSESITPVSSYVEEFCQSYKSDDTQKVKTPFGSFKWVEGLTDESSFEYYVPLNEKEGEQYCITINYIDDRDKEEFVKAAEGTVSSRMLERFAASVSYNEDTYTVDGYKIKCYKKTIRSSTQPAGVYTVMFINDLSPGIKIIIDASEKSYMKYEPQLERFINSFKF